MAGIGSCFPPQASLLRLQPHFRHSKRALPGRRQRSQRFRCQRCEKHPDSRLGTQLPASPGLGGLTFPPPGRERSHQLSRGRGYSHIRVGHAPRLHPRTSKRHSNGLVTRRSGFRYRPRRSRSTLEPFSMPTTPIHPLVTTRDSSLHAVLERIQVHDGEWRNLTALFDMWAHMAARVTDSVGNCVFEFFLPTSVDDQVPHYLEVRWGVGDIGWARPAGGCAITRV